MKRFVFKIASILALLILVGMFGCPSPATVTPTIITRGTQAILSVSPAQESYNRGCALPYEGEYETAIADCNEAIEQSPNNAIVYYHRGIVYDNIGRYDLAIADYDKAIELAPDYSIPYYNRGNAYSDLGQYDRAIADYDRAIELDPYDADSWNNKGVALENLGRYDEAKDCYDRALQLDPNHEYAQDNIDNLIAQGLVEPDDTEVPPDDTDIPADDASIAWDVANNHMYSTNIAMLNALNEIPQGTIADYRYSIQQPQHVSGSIWRVPVQVYFAVAVNMDGYSDSVALNGLEELTVDVNSRTVLSDEIISYDIQ